MNAQVRGRFWDAVLGELNLAFVQGRDGGCVSTNIDAADRIAALAAPKEAGGAVAWKIRLADGTHFLTVNFDIVKKWESSGSTWTPLYDRLAAPSKEAGPSGDVPTRFIDGMGWVVACKDAVRFVRDLAANPPSDQRQEGDSFEEMWLRVRSERAQAAPPPPEAAAAVGLRAEVARIAGDYLPDSDKDAPLALQEMRNALLAALASPTGVDEAMVEALRQCHKELRGCVHQLVGQHSGSVHIAASIKTALALGEAALAARDGGSNA